MIATAGVVVVLTFLLTAFFNYTYDWKFSSTAVVLLGILGSFGLVFLCLIDRNWQFNPHQNGINALDVYGAILLLFGALIMAGVAVALSARFNIVVTLCACIGIFLLGLVSDYVFGQLAEVHQWAQIGRLLVPNLQIFWISDAIMEESGQVTLKYLGIVGLYTTCYTGAMILLAIALFQRRQVG